jgi:hypothetical protein
MAINQKGNQDKVGNKIDRDFNKQKREIPLLERNFNDLVTLADQFEYIRLKRKQKESKPSE